VVRGETHVLTRGHDPVRDYATFQAPHPVGEHHARDPAEGLEALREQRQGRVGALVVGEAHEPDPAPREHGAEHVQPAQHAPIDDQVLTWGPHRRSSTTVIIVAPQRFPFRDQPTEVPRGTRIARSPSRWQ